MKRKLRRVLPLLHTLVEERAGERRFSPTHPALHEPAVPLEFPIRQPDLREPGRPPREIVNRVYSDTVTGETMLLRAVIEETMVDIMYYLPSLRL